MYRSQKTVTRASAIFALGLLCTLGVSAQPEKVAKSFAEVTKRVEQSVVSIDTKSKITQTTGRRGQPQGGADSDVMDFLRRQMQQRPVSGVGSGFIVDRAGYIVTNRHVIDEAARITVRLESGEEYVAKVVGSDELTDLAVLKIDARRELPAAKLGDSDKVEVGDWVLAIGSPFGLNKTVTAGIISQKQRETPFASPFQKFIQTDAAINRGNSGGPLVNLDGEVIGVNSQIATSTGDYNGVGFALPSNETAFVLDQIIKNGRVRRGYLGVLLDSVKSEFASVYGLKEAKGAIITDIRDTRGPAARAGLQVGDVIIQMNGRPVSDAQDLIARVAATDPDQSVNVVLLREAGTALESKSIAIKLGERPSNGDGENDRRELPIEPSTEQKPFGLTLIELTPTVASQYRFEGQKGVVVKEINPTSFIADIKNANGMDALGQGDLIQRINRVNVSDVKAFNEVVGGLKIGDPVVLHVRTYNPALRTTQMKIVQFTVR